MAGPKKRELEQRVRDLGERNVELLASNLNYAEGVVLDAKDLRQTERQFPNWRLGIDLEAGAPAKVFVRMLPDLAPRLRNNPDLAGALLISSAFRDGLGAIFTGKKEVRVLLPGPDVAVDGHLEIRQPTVPVCLTRYDALAVGMADALLCNLGMVNPVDPNQSPGRIN